jgi:hypothetical protein
MQQHAGSFTGFAGVGMMLTFGAYNNLKPTACSLDRW